MTTVAYMNGCSTAHYEDAKSCTLIYSPWKSLILLLLWSKAKIPGLCDRNEEVLDSAGLVLNLS